MRRLNDELGRINDRHSEYRKMAKGDPNYKTKQGQAYIKEVNKTWQKIYMDQLKTSIGKDPIDNGYEWIKEQSAYHLFSSFVDNKD